METKNEIRKRMLEVRNNLTEENIKSKSEQIVQRLFQTPEYDEAHNVLLYADYNNEVMTSKIFEDAIKRGKRVYYPKSDALTNTMDFYKILTLTQLHKGYMGIMEPRAIDINTRYRLNKSEDTLIIVPGVAFDIEGYRLGYGKGFYDKYLTSKRQMSTIALAFSEQIVDAIPHDTYDIKMDKIVTEEIIYSFLRI